MDPLTILAALAPVGVDLVKGLIGRFVMPEFKPASIADWVTMQAADLERFKAVSNAGGNAPTYAWVEAVKQLMRPTVAVIALGVWAYSRTCGTASPAVDNFAGAIGFYLFGDRTLFYAKQK